MCTLPQQRWRSARRNPSTSDRRPGHAAPTPSTYGRDCESGTGERAEQGSDAWARVFAAIYDPFLWLGERVTLGALRQDLIGRAEGRTVELGSGTGLKSALLPRRSRRADPH